MSKIIVDDQADLEAKFIRLVGFVMTHIKWQKIYAEQFGHTPKRLKKESLDKLEDFIRDLRIVKKDDGPDREKITDVIIKPDL